MDERLTQPLTPKQVGARISMPVRYDGEKHIQMLTGQCCLMNLQMQTDAMASIYGWVLARFQDDLPVLEADAQSKWHHIPPTHPSQVLKLMEICSGMAGTSLGARAAGLTPLVACDKSALACQLLEMNQHPCVVHGDIADDSTKEALHAALDGQRGGLIGGFPCQPFSRLGNARCFQDERSTTFYKVMDVAMLTQASWVLLECVKPAGRTTEVPSILQHFADLMGFHWCQVDLHQHRTWPAHRARWWALLIPRSMVLPALRDLPLLPEWQTLENVITEWAIWSKDDEDKLLLNDFELSYFLDENYGPTDRCLRMDQPAPTLLHSLGSQLFSCPCGCRKRFAETTLLNKGLHGITVQSQRYPGKLRHPHPLEAAMIAGIPGTIQYGDMPREMLTQIGQVASPIQSHWILVQFLHAQLPTDQDIPWVHSTAQPTPDQLHRRYLRYILKSHKKRWPSAEQYQRRVLSVQPHDEPAYALILDAPTTARDLVLAHRASTLQQEKKVVIDGPEVLGPDDLIATDEVALWRDEMIGYGLDFSLRDTDSPVLGRSYGLDDLTIHHEARHLFCKAEIDETSFWTPRFVTLIQDVHSHTANELLVHALRGKDTVHTIALDSHHWLYIQFIINGDLLMVNVMDGARDNTTPEIDAFIQRVYRASGRLHLQEKVTYLVKQTHGTHCGAIALIHLGHQLHLWQRADEITAELWHQQLLRKQDFARFGGSPGGSSDAEQAVITWLKGFLPNKGVAPEALDSRIKAAITKLGVNALHEAIHSQQPWKQLKQCGMGQGKPFQWVTAGELEAQVHKRSQEKFKTQKDKAKHRRKMTAPKNDQMGLHLTPENLSIPPNSFVDTELTEVPMVTFQQIGSDTRGIAICTIEQATTVNSSMTRTIYQLMLLRLSQLAE